jgi:hypothetical protein
LVVWRRYDRGRVGTTLSFILTLTSLLLLLLILRTPYSTLQPRSYEVYGLALLLILLLIFASRRGLRALPGLLPHSARWRRLLPAVAVPLLLTTATYLLVIEPQFHRPSPYAPRPCPPERIHPVTGECTGESEMVPPATQMVNFTQPFIPSPGLLPGATPQQELLLSLASLAALLALVVLLLAGRGGRPPTEPSLEEVWRWSQTLPEGDPRRIVIECYREAVQILEGRGFRRAPHQTAGEYERQVVRLAPTLRQAITPLTRLYEEARYSQHPMGLDRAEAAKGFLDQISSTPWAPPH